MHKTKAFFTACKFTKLGETAEVRTYLGVGTNRPHHLEAGIDHLSARLSIKGPAGRVLLRRNAREEMHPLRLYQLLGAEHWKSPMTNNIPTIELENRISPVNRPLLECLLLSAD